MSIKWLTPVRVEYDVNALLPASTVGYTATSPVTCQLLHWTVMLKQWALCKLCWWVEWTWINKYQNVHFFYRLLLQVTKLGIVRKTLSKTKVHSWTLYVHTPVYDITIQEPCPHILFHGENLLTCFGGITERSTTKTNVLGIKHKVGQPFWERT